MSLASSARSLVAVENPSLVYLVSTAHGANEFFSIIIPPLIPFLVPSLDIGYAEASLLVSIFFITYSVVQLPVGKLVDVWSTRWLLGGGMVVLAVGIALVALAPSFELMLAGMVVAGVGGSTYHPTGMAVISDAESDATHGRSMGIHGAFGTFGSMLAPVLMVAVAAASGWQAALLVGAGLGLVFGVVLFVLYPLVHPDGVEPDDGRRAVDAFTGFDPGDLLGRLWRYVTTPTVLGLSALFLAVGGEVRAVQTWTTSFAAEAAAADPTYGSWMLGITMVAAGVASAFAGAGVDRVDRRLFTAGCFVLTAVVVAGLVFLPLGRLLLPVGFVVLGVVMYSVYPAANAIAAGATANMESGSLFAVTQTAAALGGAGGPFLLGVVADAATMEMAFLATAGIALGGLLVVVVFGSAFDVGASAA